MFTLTRIQKAVTFYAIALGAALVVALVMPDTDAMAYAVGETGVITLVLVAIVAWALLGHRSEPAAAPERAV